MKVLFQLDSRFAIVSMTDIQQGQTVNLLSVAPHYVGGNNRVEIQNLDRQLDMIGVVSDDVRITEINTRDHVLLVVDQVTGREYRVILTILNEGAVVLGSNLSARHRHVITELMEEVDHVLEISKGRKTVIGALISLLEKEGTVRPSGRNFSTIYQQSGRDLIKNLHDVSEELYKIYVNNKI